MTSLASSPLPALIDYYRRLEADPAQQVAEFGFSREKIHFQIVLNLEGEIGAVEDLRATSERGSRIPDLRVVPDGGGRSGTSLKPFFCWDNTGYALGADRKGNSDRARAKFASFRDLHVAVRDNVGNDPGYDALCRFLERWDPSQATTLSGWDELAGKNVVFRLRGHQEFIHDSPRVKEAWRSRLKATNREKAARGISILSGKKDTLARLHPLMKGVSHAQPTGAALVSFNQDAFTSYGRTQSYNSPLSETEAFQYTTALNRLLADTDRRTLLGDATVVFWTDRPEATDVDTLMMDLFGDSAPRNQGAESSELKDRLAGFLRAARDGRLGEVVEDPDAPYYVLGLSPNAGRLSVRFWIAGSVAQFASRLALHAEHLAVLDRGEEAPLPGIRRLLCETARAPEDIPPQLAGEVARAVLAGLPYPQVLFAAVVRRIHADRRMNPVRVAILKAYLVRNRKKEVPMALNTNHADEAYQLGRLFAVLEKTQEDSSERQLNATIKDRYFGAASATPSTVFPLLLRLHQHHLAKIEKPGWRINREKLVTEICSRISRFPLHLSLERQGLFYIAYYHQRQDLFTRKSPAAQEQTDE